MALMASPLNTTQICAVITTYRPNASFISRVARVRAQVGLTVIVDDGAMVSNERLLHDGLGDFSDVIIQHNSENVGLAASLNIGFAIAQMQGFGWVLSLDDDTLIKPDMVVSLIEARKVAVTKSKKSIAIIGMRYSEEDVFDKSLPTEKTLFLEKRGIITSGSLISLFDYLHIGPFREEFFIDSVDYDFCLRARAKGFRVMEVCKVGMIHHLGQCSRHQIGPFVFETTNHDPKRRYYAARNSTVLMREYFTRDPLYTLAVIFFHIKTQLLVLLFECDKRKKYEWMGRGFLDAWGNHLGKCRL